MHAEHAPVERWERVPGAASAPLRGYGRREPERTLLHAVVRERLEPFLAAARQHGSGRGLPAHVERDLEADHLGLCPQTPPAAKAPVPAADLPAEAEPEYDCVDPVFEG